MSSPAPGPVRPDTSHLAMVDHRETARWQRKLLPYMTRFLIVIAIGFFAISLLEMYEMRNFVKNEATQPVRLKIEQMMQTAQTQNAADTAQSALLVLEADALDKRYRQASTLLMSRIWTRQLAFMTGMVLSFIGAVFIIGKLSESATDVNVSGGEWKAGITSASPGLILAFFGSLLMGIALIVQPGIEVQDRPVYFMSVGVVKQASATQTQATTKESPLPDPFGDMTAVVTGSSRDEPDAKPKKTDKKK
ncbi:hypothetical protein Acid345_2706 [Candidatus Koribacter versatilis Ellin345]|uniref:Uncharacterized protein n=1 Tax=Koribacter versatilis (strain Ellin345) TaxID=204669 RepID=Q1IN43_KORVE|nr:hypothetical protein [Candidatus Koribacter versatilis]ABF41707.1 hypothetical protein Acid345_2706 [Candidatus Koribacter versatilis Ellin345]